MGESPQSVVSMRSENVTEIANTNSDANGGTLGAKRRREEYMLEKINEMYRLEDFNREHSIIYKGGKIYD